MAKGNRVSEKTPRVEIQDGDSDEWPEAVKRRFEYLTEVAKNNDFSVLCAVGLHHEHKRLSVFFGPHTSANPDLWQLCEDVAEFFQLMAKRLKQ